MKRTLVAIALAGLYATASAQGYAGAVAGMANLDLDCKGVISCDKKGTGGKIYAGQRFDKNPLVNLGRFKIDTIEVGYLRFGNASAQLSSTTTGPELVVDPDFNINEVTTTRIDSIRAKSEALVFAGVGRVEIIPRRFDATAKLGVAYVNSTVDNATTINTSTIVNFDPASLTNASRTMPTGSKTTSKFQPYFGLGVEVRVIDKLSVVGGIDFTKFEVDGRKGDLRLVSLGAQYEF